MPWPSASAVIPVWPWKDMKDWTRGVVRTPPKSEITALTLLSDSVIGPDQLVVTQALAALDRPAEEGDLGDQPRPAHPGGADQRARAAQRLSLFAVWPELERRPPLHAVGPVLGREQRLRHLDRGAVGAAEDGGQLLVAVLAAAGRAHRAQRQQAAVGEDDADRSPLHLSGVLAHAAAAYSAQRNWSLPESAQPTRTATRLPASPSTRPMSRPAPPRSSRIRPLPASSPSGSPPPWRPTPGSSASAGERWSVTPTPARTARVRPTAGRSRSRCTWRRGSAAGAAGALSTRSWRSGCECRASTSPARESPCPTRPASPCTRRWDSSP